MFTIGLVEYLELMKSTLGVGTPPSPSLTIEPQGPFTPEELLEALDEVMAANPDFGEWVQDQLASRPVVPDCRGLTVSACQDQLPDGSSVSVTSGPIDPESVILTQGTAPGTDIDDPVTVDVETEAWTVDPPQPYPEVYSGDADHEAQRIMVTNPDFADQYTAQDVETIARQCVWLAARVAAVSASDCGSLPIFIAGRGDFPQSSDHIKQALGHFPGWTMLRYYQRPESERDWKLQYGETEGGPPPCQGNMTDYTACDEVPFFKTEQGAEWNSDGLPHPAGQIPHLEVIDYGQNSGTGNRYGGMVLRCKMQERRSSSQHGSGNFLLIPVSAPIVTYGFCNGSNP